MTFKTSTVLHRSPHPFTAPLCTLRVAILCFCFTLNTLPDGDKLAERASARALVAVPRRLVAGAPWAYIYFVLRSNKIRIRNLT